MNVVEVKAAVAVDEAGIVSGMAWPFGTPDRVKDRITKGAFAGAAPPIPMLAFHNPDDPIGVWEEITETDEGLQVKGRLLIGQVARADEVHAMVIAGAVKGLSIGFSIQKSTGTKGHNRTISALDLVEISLVSVPSHPNARITEAKRLDPAASAIRLAAALNRAALALRN